MSTNTIKLASAEGDKYIAPQQIINYKGIELFGYGYLDWGTIVNQSLIRLIDTIDSLQDSGFSEIQFDLTEYEETQKRLRSEEFNIWKTGFRQTLDELIQGYVDTTETSIEEFVSTQTTINENINKIIVENFKTLSDDITEITTELDQRIINTVQDQIRSVTDTVNNLTNLVQRANSNLETATSEVNKVIASSQQLISDFKNEFNTSFNTFKEETNTALKTNKDYLIEYIDTKINSTNNKTSNFEERLLSLELVADSLNPDTVRLIITTKVNEITSGIIATYLENYEDRLDTIDGIILKINDDIPSLIESEVKNVADSVTSKLEAYDQSLLNLNKTIIDMTGDIEPIKEMRIDIVEVFGTIEAMVNRILDTYFISNELFANTIGESKEYHALSKNILEAVLNQNVKNSERTISYINSIILNFADSLGNSSFDELSLIKRTDSKIELLNNINSEISDSVINYGNKEFKYLFLRTLFDVNKIQFAFKLPRNLVIPWNVYGIQCFNTTTGEMIESNFQANDNIFNLQEPTHIGNDPINQTIPLDQINSFQYSFELNSSSFVSLTFDKITPGDNFKLKIYSDENFNTLIIDSEVSLDDMSYLNPDPHYINNIYPNLYMIDSNINKPVAINQDITWSNMNDKVLVPVCEIQTKPNGSKLLALKVKLPNTASLTNIDFNDGFTSQVKTFINHDTFPLTEAEFTTRNLGATNNYYKDICSTGIVLFDVNNDTKKITGTITYKIGSTNYTYDINSSGGGSNSTIFIEQTIVSGQYVDIDTQTYFGSIDARKVGVDVKVKDENSTSETYNMWINGDNLSTIAIKDNRYVRIYNEFMSDLIFYIALTDR